MTEIIEIDFGRILKALWRRGWALALAAMAGASGCALGAEAWITPQYTSSVIFYIRGNGTAPVDSAIVVLETKATRREVLQVSGINRSEGEIEAWIFGEAIRATDFLKVEVTAPDAVEAKVLADGVAKVLPRRMSEILGTVTAQVVDEADFATQPSTLSTKQWAVLGAVLGTAMAAGIVALAAVFSKKQ